MRLFLCIISVFVLNCSSTKKSIDEQYPEYSSIAENSSGTSVFLEGRYPVRRPVPNYSCSAEGSVVVGIKVNRKGLVVEAVPGIKGSTTKNKCLLEKSKEAALKTTWQPLLDGPEEQIGKVIYNFSLY